jgi:hypothetical protein
MIMPLFARIWMKPEISESIGRRGALRMNNKTRPPVGIIAEDDCDVDSIRTLIHRIKNNTNIGVRKFVGKGCGKINRKSNAWANQLKQKGCTTLILVHDLDAHDLVELNERIRTALEPSAINNYLICIQG